jgi:hypothetical protein
MALNIAVLRYITAAIAGETKIVVAVAHIVGLAMLVIFARMDHKKLVL